MNGTFSQRPGASLVGNQGSGMEILLNTASGDTLYLDPQNNILRTLRIGLNDAGTLMLGSDLRITSRLDLGKGKIDIGDHDLVIDPMASVKNYNDNSYIVTSGSGKLIMRVNSGSPYVVFPVGTSSGYLPASIQQVSGGSGNFTVRVREGVYSNGSSGYNSALQHSVVNGTWLIGSGSGLTVNMTLKLGWKSSAEVNGFNRSNAYITHYANKWDSYTMAGAQPGPNNTFELVRTGITSLDAFAVADNNSALPVDRIHTQADDILVFPNPASEYISVIIPNATNDCKIELIDITGKVLQTSTGQDHADKFSVAGLGNGYYLVRITDAQTGVIQLKQFCKY
jgi:hypothetical protein